MLSEIKIKDLEHQDVSYEEFLMHLKELEKLGLDLFVGTDSQNVRGKISMITCLCFYKTGVQRSKVFYTREVVDMVSIPTLRAKILREAIKSLELALSVEDLFSNKISIHLDVGTDSKKSKSADFKKELQIMVTSQGFECKIKPDSWASSAIADKLSKIYYST